MPNPRIDDVIQFLISYLRTPPPGTVDGNTYGYDLYIPNACGAYARTIEGLTRQDPGAVDNRTTVLSPIFYDAAWELCRRGILRHSVKAIREQHTEDGSAGNGYSVTAMGRTWLQDAEHAVYIPLEPSRFAELIGNFRARLGDGFFQRAQEAAKCHFATAYLACCAMCGAAAESILLHIAIEKQGDEDQVLRTYRAAQGRRNLEQLITTDLRAPLAATFGNLTDLLKYWRDDASHGTASEISELEAHEALTRLLRFAQFATDHWDELTA